MVARGLGNRQVSRTLGISKRTVEKHVYEAMQHLNAQNRTEAAYLWLRHHHERERAALQAELVRREAQLEALKRMTAWEVQRELARRNGVA